MRWPSVTGSSGSFALGGPGEQGRCLATISTASTPTLGNFIGEFPRQLAVSMFFLADLIHVVALLAARTLDRLDWVMTAVLGLTACSANVTVVVAPIAAVNNYLLRSS